MKLNCLTLDVDTCQLSSFSVPRPPGGKNQTVSTALVKTLALTPQNFSSPPPLLPSPSLLVPPETTVCDYKRTITPPKASRCNTFSLPSFISSAVKLFFQVLIFHFQYENITIRGREGGGEREVEIGQLWDKAMKGIDEEEAASGDKALRDVPVWRWALSRSPHSPESERRKVPVSKTTRIYFSGIFHNTSSQSQKVA